MADFSYDRGKLATVIVCMNSAYTEMKQILANVSEQYESFKGGATWDCDKANSFYTSFSTFVENFEKCNKAYDTYTDFLNNSLSPNFDAIEQDVIDAFNAAGESN